MWSSVVSGERSTHYSLSERCLTPVFNGVWREVNLSHPASGIKPMSSS